MGVSSTEQLLAVLEKSQLLEAEQLDEARRIVQDQPRPKPAARSLVKAGLLTRWQAGQLLAGRSSFLLSKYKLIDLLGRGGMGSVFLAQHRTMNRQVALKVVSREIAEDPAALERFLAEARAIASLNHRNIVQAYSVDNEGSRYYIVMEYVDGPDLRRLVRDKGPLDYRRAAEYVRQVAEGLAHAHQQKIIHCDIKPSNLLVNAQGVVKILDMGLARLAGRTLAAGPDQSENVQGSVDYLAPEQARADGQFDHRADIYALGCTLYHLLTGRPPFPEGTVPERLMQHQTRQPPEITQLRPDVPEQLAAVCRKMTAKKPDDRYQSAQEVVEALSQWRLPPRPSRRVKSLDAGAPASAPNRPPKRSAANGRAADDDRSSWWDDSETDADQSPRGRSPAGPSAAQTKEDEALPGRKAGKRPTAETEHQDAAEAMAALAAGAAAAGVRKTKKKKKTHAAANSKQAAGKTQADGHTTGTRSSDQDKGPDPTSRIDVTSATAKQSKDLPGARPLLGSRERKTLLASVGILALGGAAALIVLLVMRPWAGPSSESPEAGAAGPGAGASGTSSPVVSVPEPDLEPDIDIEGQIPEIEIPESSSEPSSPSSGESGQGTPEQPGAQSPEPPPDTGGPKPGGSETASPPTTPEPGPETPSPETPGEPATPEPSGPGAEAPSEPTGPGSEPGSEGPPVGEPGDEPPQSEAGGQTEPKPPGPRPGGRPKPPKPPARPDPLKGLLASAELPILSGAPGARAPASLGRVELGPEESLNVSLVGGDEAIKGPLGFELQAEPSRPNSWLVKLGAPGQSAEPGETSDVARLWLDAGELKLTWLDTAEAQARSLGNCGLSISARGKTRWLPLSRVRPAEPVVLDLDYGMARRQVSLETPPDPAALRLQITGFDGELPKPEYKPGDTVAPKDRGDPQRGMTWLNFVLQNTPQLSLRVSFSLVGRRADVEVAAFYQLANQQPQPFRAREVAAALSRATLMKQQMEAAVGQLKGERKKALQQQIEVAKSVVDQLTGLGNLYQSLNKKGAVHYRLFVVAGEEQIELFDTRAAPAEPEESAVWQAGRP